MSLLLDARKKSQGENQRPSGLTLSPEGPPPNKATSVDVESARTASHNLFKAKSNAAGGKKVSRNLIYFVMASLVLFAAGGAYVWYETSAYSRPSYRPAAPVAAPAVAPQAYTPPPPVPRNEPVKPVETAATPAEPKVTVPAPQAVAQLAPSPAPAAHPKPAATKPRLEPHVAVSGDADSLDSLLNRGYQAYTAGKYEQAQGYYQDALGRDGRNTDALLGLAAIAQRRGADTVAVQYYGKVLALDPRNPVANAGMSALRTDDNMESHLKLLLAEQKDSSSLYFALGNHYAKQSRWSEAQQAYFNACNLEPRNANLAYNLAVSLERLGQKKPAVQYYRRALELDTGNSAGFDHAAIARHAQLLAE